MKKIVLFLLFALFLFGCDPAEEEIKILSEGYEDLFTHGLIHDIEIRISQAEWDGLIQDLKAYIKTGHYRSATFIYNGPAGEATIEEVGFRVKGNLSRVIPEDDSGTFHRAHFKVRFNHEFDLVEGTEEYEQREERRFCQLRALNIRMPAWGSGSWDVTQIREMFSYDLFKRAGCYTSKTGSARLFITINGVKRYFGVYNLEEPIDKTFLSKRYSKDGNDGNLYKCIHGDSGPASLEPVDGVDGPGNATEIYPERKIMGSKDWTQEYRPTYDLKTNEDEADHTGLLDFIYNLNALDGQDLREYLDENFEIGRFLRYLAMNFLINRWDDYTTIGNNYFLYFHNDGKIEFMTVDHDSALDAVPFFYGASAGIYDWQNYSNELIAIIAGVPLWYLDSIRDYKAPLTDKIFTIPEYRSLYETYLTAFITPANKLFLYSEFKKKYDQQRALYLPYLNNDINEGEYMGNPASVRNFFYEKTQAIVDQLGLDEDDYETGP